MVDLSCNMKKTQSGMRVFCSYCLHASVLAIKRCLSCEAFLCQNHLRVHSRSIEHTLTDVHALQTFRQCPFHGLDFSSYCLDCKACLCYECKKHNFHRGHYQLKLKDAHQDKKKRLNEVLIELTTKREKIPDQIQQLELAREWLTQKIGDVIFLVNTNDPLTVLQERESEKSDFFIALVTFIAH